MNFLSVSINDNSESGKPYSKIKHINIIPQARPKKYNSHLPFSFTISSKKYIIRAAGQKINNMPAIGRNMKIKNSLKNSSTI